MALINAWHERASPGEHTANRSIYVHCDGCFPPRWAIGTARQLSSLGWRLADLDTEPHLCPSCARESGPPQLRLRCASQASPALPNLMVVGAQKCGTVSLHRYLALHPEIYMSELKEPNFFQDPQCVDRLDLYASLFDSEFAIRGESSPAYTFFPLAPGVPARMKVVVPEVRLVYLVRDPVQRLISAYMEASAKELETRSFDEAVIQRLDEPHNRYVAAGRYAMQLEEYLTCFSREQLLILDREDLLIRRRDTLSEVFRFLGVDDSYVSPGFDEVFNTRATKRRRTRLGRLARRTRHTGPLQWLYRTAPETISRPMRQLASRQLQAPQIDPPTMTRLREFYRADADRLCDLAGRDFAHWDLHG